MDLLKRMAARDGFRIYFWPIVIWWALAMGLLAIFLPMKPHTQRELIFVCLGGMLNVGLLWTLVYRYRRVMGRPLNKRTMIMLGIVTAVMAIGVIGMLAELLCDFLIS